MIVIGGMIGLGKTSVAEKLAKELNSEVFYESVEGNKILPLFYTASDEEIQKKRYPFLLQLWFMNTRFASIKKAMSNKDNVLDRSIYEDWYFAEKNRQLGRISDLEMEIYNNLLNNIMLETPNAPKKSPDLMVYLKGSFNTVMNHINQRGRSFELGEDLINYYHFLWEGYDDWMYNNYKASKVVTINMDENDVVNSEEDCKKVMDVIKKALAEARK